MVTFLDLYSMMLLGSEADMEITVEITTILIIMVMFIIMSGEKQKRQR